MAKEFIVYSTTRASFEAQVASGEVDNTQIGIIAESGEFWENGNYHPLVMLTDYLKKTDAVNFAKDLSGSLEPTPEVFTFRASAGDKSIRDASALIRRIKGNSMLFAQLCKNGNFEDGLTDWGTLANVSISQNSNGSMRVTHTGSSSQGVLCRIASPIPSGHKVMVIIDYARSSSASANMLIYLVKSSGYDRGYIYNVATTARRTDAVIITATDTISSNLFIYPFISGATGAYTDIYSCQVFDLTTIFGSGNEPTSLSEFKRCFPNSYYSTQTPTLNGVMTTGIETVGCNAFDKTLAIGGTISNGGAINNSDVYSVATFECLPNEEYYFKNVANGLYVPTYAVFDSDMNFLQVNQFADSVTKLFNVSFKSSMPANARYLRVCVHNDYLDTCCVNLSHSGTRNGEYAEYKRSVRILPEIAKYFSDGMYRVGDVCDEINENYAITRIGIRAYEDGDEMNALVVTDGSRTAYILDEPIITPLLEPIQLDYDVEDFGTERALCERTSAPFSADIVYQFNAADRIRDNARNIERLEAMMNNEGTSEKEVYITDFTMQDIMSGVQFPADCVALEEAVRADKIIFIPYNKEEGYSGGCVASVWLDDVMYITIPTDYGKTLYLEVAFGAQDIDGQPLSFYALNTINGQAVEGSHIQIKDVQRKVGAISGDIVMLTNNMFTAITNGVQDITIQMPTSVPTEDNIQRCGVTFSTGVLTPSVGFSGGTIMWEGGTAPAIASNSTYEMIFTWHWYMNAWLGKCVIYK